MAVIVDLAVVVEQLLCLVGASVAGAEPGEARVVGGGGECPGFGVAAKAQQDDGADDFDGACLLFPSEAGSAQLTKAWADTGYRTKVIDHGATLGINVEVTRRSPAHKGFKVIPRRWVVDRTFGWLMHHRRPARDYETHPHRSVAMIKLAMVDLIGRRLTRESTPNWRHA